MLEAILPFLKDKQKILVASHSRPDGDAIGSSLGLGFALRASGREAVVLSADPVPSDYRRLPGAGEIQVVSEVPSGFDAGVILECNGPERTGIGGWERYPLVNIDHHASAENFGHLNWIDTSFGALGQMVLRLIDALGVKVTPEMATPLYVALMTDTGCFQFANTTARELSDAARLVDCGARPAQVADWVYRSFTPQRIRLLGIVLDTLEMDRRGQIAWVVMTRNAMLRAGARPEDTEGIINHLMAIETVRLAAFFKQDSEDRFKISLRSKEDLDVSRIAAAYQGGGHVNAAGFTFCGGLEEARQQVIGHLERLLADEPLS